MTERKVINKYYPPDFDPSKLPRLRLQKNRQFNVRIMAPCNMKCNTCGEYIYKGKKFNSRQETVEGETFLGLRIYRFYIKCPRCMSEITFKTNLEEMDYELEQGATRNFQAVRLAEQEEERVEEARLEEEKSNPMIALERRTQDSRYEMDRLEALEELKDLNVRQANVNYNEVIKMTVEKEMVALQEQEEADEAFIRSIFSKEDGSAVIKRLHDSDSDEEDDKFLHSSLPKSSETPTDLFVQDCNSSAKKMKATPKQELSWERSIGGLGQKNKSLAGLIKPKYLEKTPHYISPVSNSGEGSSSKSVAGGLGVLINQYGSSSSDED